MGAHTHDAKRPCRQDGCGALGGESLAGRKFTGFGRCKTRSGLGAAWRGDSPYPYAPKTSI